MSTTFNMTRNDFCKSILRGLGVLASGETASADEINDVAQALNIMLKEWQTECHLWLRTEATLFLATGQRQYNLPGANCTKTYIETTLTADSPISDTTLTVSSISGITDGQNIGILLDTLDIFWTTVNGVPSGSTVTLLAGLPSAASTGRQVFAYTSKIERPLRVYNIRRRDLTGNEIIFAYDGEPMSRADYMALPNKTTLGLPIQGYYDPQLTTGVLSLWSTPADATYKIPFTYDRSIEDIVNIGDFTDLPQEWLAAIKWNGMIEVSPEYPDIKVSPIIIKRAMESKAVVMAWDVDQGSTFISPGFR